MCVIVPVFNEAAVVGELWRRIDAVAARAPRYAFRIVFVDDGSRDGSFDELTRLAAHDPRITALKLSRNFGKEAAMTAGLDFAVGDWTVIIDADLQDPPELMLEMLAKAEQGYDVVYARRHARRGETWQKKFFAHLFYRLMGALNPGFDLPRDTGDYRVMSRRAVAAVLRLRETHRFMKGIFAWIGFPSAEVLYDREPRHEGRSKFSFLKLLNHAIDGITSFSTAPLRIATYLGLLVSLAAFVYGSVIVVQTLLYGNPVAGFPTLITSVLFIGGVQLLCLGIIGEYVGRIYGESKQRPLYLIERVVGAAPAVASGTQGAEATK
ncbi:glycosyltransferase family 2 protein [Sinimarinibacterium thermocellulolyticum]|uniref:Glycosyltransferase family 2 protein n=1 Tax=Sinimarinibacterium thermocellulolyticum TaxID=3170016 RepID=A0ABV2A8L8_9GAMM